MLYEIFMKEGVCAEEKFQKAEEDAKEKFEHAEDIAKADISYKEKCYGWMQEIYVSQASDAAVELEKVNDTILRLREINVLRSKKVTDLEGEISRYVFSLRQMCYELDHAKKHISELKEHVSDMKVADTQNAAKIVQLRQDLVKSVEGMVIMEDEEGEDQADTFYYHSLPSLSDKYQAPTGPVTRGVQKVHYLVRHLGSDILKCSMFSNVQADEIISVKDASNCYTTYIHTKKRCRAAIIDKCLKAAAEVRAFKIVCIPAFEIKNLTQYRAIAMAIRHQHESLTMETTNASNPSPFRQFRAFLPVV